MKINDYDWGMPVRFPELIRSARGDFPLVGALNLGVYMNSQATREILWNLDPLPTSILMYSLLVLAILIGFVGVLRRVELIASGTPDSSRDDKVSRQIVSLVKWVVLQRGVRRVKAVALSHSLIYVGFVVLLFTTTMVFLQHDLGLPIYQGRFYLATTLLSDLFGLGVIIGCALIGHRRYVRRPDALHSSAADRNFLLLIVLLCVQGFLLEGLRIHVTNDPWALYSPVGWLIARMSWFLSNDSASLLHFVIWWFHTVTVFSVIALAPYSKFFHVLASSANLFFRASEKRRGVLRSPGNLMEMIEAGEEFTIGLGNIKDYSWKQLLDLDACTSCGRCQDACPAYNSGKVLSPKWMILDTRNHALLLHSKEEITDSKVPTPLRKLDQTLTQRYVMQTSGVRPSENQDSFHGEGPHRAESPAVQQAVKELGKSADQRIAGSVMDANVFWSCNTCLACVEACPVGINHVDMIVENRRNMVLMEGEVPSEAAPTLRALENRANPYGPAEDRTKWLEDLEVKVLEPGDSVDFLYWVGCVSAYDPRKQKIARALVKVMNAANLSFGILGTSEGCSGDPARRLGEENLFQTLAKQNMEVLRTVQFKTLVANCPHCFNTIKNEYPDFGNLGEGRTPEIIHHSVLLKRLIGQGKIKLSPGAEETVTFHDPCYLGRANGEYDAPREVLAKHSSLKIVEMNESREKSMCCGAGGGHFWMDMKVGERVNAMRFAQATQTGAQKIATACPFCMQMLEDGAKLANQEEAVKIRDLAEFVAENLQ